MIALKPKPVPRSKPVDPSLWLALFAALFLPPKVLTVTEAADLVGRTEAAVRCWCRAGRIGRWHETLKVWLIDCDELIAFAKRKWKKPPARLAEFTFAKNPDPLSSPYEPVSSNPSQRSANCDRASAVRRTATPRRANDISANNRHSLPRAPRPGRK
jgi:hypothetical protein